MRYKISFTWLMIFLFAVSCQGPKSDLKGDSGNQINMSESKGTNHRELAPKGKKGQNYIPGEILVKFKDGTSLQIIEAIQKKLGLRTIKVVPKLNIYHMKIRNGASVEGVMKRLKDFLEVEYSEPNYIVDFH